jgi:hypothetical protein
MGSKESSDGDILFKAAASIGIALVAFGGPCLASWW